jgi:ribosomal protein S18
MQKTEYRSLVEGECYSVNYMEYPDVHRTFSRRVLENGKIVPRDIIVINGSAYNQPIASMSGKICQVRKDDGINITTNRYDDVGMDVMERIKVSIPGKWKTVK